MIDVNARATEAGALLEWRALTPLMRKALAGSWVCHGGRARASWGVMGGVVSGLRRRKLLGGRGTFLTARAVYVREVGMADDARAAGARKRDELAGANR